MVNKNESGHNSIIYHMLHNAIICEYKTTINVRIVFGAFLSKANFPSLNDGFSPVPNLTSYIVILFLQFRLNKVVITPEIKCSFLQSPLGTKE